MPIALLPIGTDAPTDQRQQVAGQVLYLDPGKDEETTLVDDPGKIAGP